MQLSQGKFLVSKVVGKLVCRYTHYSLCQSEFLGQFFSKNRFQIQFRTALYARQSHSNSYVELYDESLSS